MELDSGITFYNNAIETIKPKINHLLENFHGLKQYPNTKTCEAMDKHGSNKNHRQHVIYTPFYDALFQNLNPTGVLEFGIGSQDPTILFNMSGQPCIPGGSLRAWRELFTTAEIFGADIDKKCLFTEERIHTFEVDALNVESIKQMWKQIQTDFPHTEIQIMIDDAYHNTTANINLVENSIQHLASNGYYVIEDINRGNTHINDIKNWLKEHNYDSILLDIPNNTNRSCNCLAIIKKQ